MDRRCGEPAAPIPQPLGEVLADLRPENPVCRDARGPDDHDTAHGGPQVGSCLPERTL